MALKLIDKPLQQQTRSYAVSQDLRHYFFPKLENLLFYIFKNIKNGEKSYEV